MSANNAQAGADIGLEPLRHYASPNHPPEPDQSIPPPPYFANIQLPRQLTWMAHRPTRKRSCASILATALCIMTAMIVIFTLAWAIHLYNSSRYSKFVTSQGFIANAWPVNGIDITTTALLLTAAIVIVLQIVATTIVSKRIELRSRRVAIVVVSLVAAAFLLVSIVLFKLNIPGESLYTRSCDLGQAELVWDDNEIGLNQICNTLSASWGLAIAALVFNLASLVTLQSSAASSKAPRAKGPLRGRRSNYRKVEGDVAREASPAPLIAGPTEYRGYSADRSTMLGHYDPRMSRDSGEGA